MKYIIASLFALFLTNGLPQFAMAQTAAVKDIPADGDTNISITKGQKVTEKNFEIVDQSGEIEGEPEVMAKDARASWKKACDDWKKETKELNKENQVLALNCNHAECSKTENATTTCKSTGTFKVKTKIR